MLIRKHKVQAISPIPGLGSVQQGKEGSHSVKADKKIIKNKMCGSTCFQEQEISILNSWTITCTNHLSVLIMRVE